MPNTLSIVEGCTRSPGSNSCSCSVFRARGISRSRSRTRSRSMRRLASGSFWAACNRLLPP